MVLEDDNKFCCVTRSWSSLVLDPIICSWWPAGGAGEPGSSPAAPQVSLERAVPPAEPPDPGPPAAGGRAVAAAQGS